MSLKHLTPQFLAHQQTVIIVEAPQQCFYAQEHWSNVSDLHQITQIYYKQVNKEIRVEERNQIKRK